MSGSPTTPTARLVAHISQAEKDAIQASGQLFVASAGNGGPDKISDNNDNPDKANYPSSYDSANILSVAAIDNKGRLASTSNYGANSVDLSAPGVDILGPYPGGPYYYRDGTSFAAPHATGTAALAASVNPELLADPAGLKKRIMDTSKPVPSTAGKTVTGGMVDARAVTNAASTPPSLAPGDEDTAAPTGSVSINDGARKTTKRKVTLTLEASDPEPGSGVTQMRFSKNDGRTWTTWQPYASSASFKLGKRAGKQKVYVQFRDSAGNKSSTFQDSIKYAPR